MRFLLLLFGLLPSTLLYGTEPITPASVANAPVLGRRVVDLGTHKITYLRIAPPQLAKLPVPRPVPSRQLTPQEQAMEDAREAKTRVQLFFSITVYPGSATLPTISDLSWWKDGKRYQCWANIDFRLFNQFTELETETHIFNWFPGVGEGSIEGGAAAERPAGFALFTAADAPGYYFEGNDEDMGAVADTLLGLDYFCAYYQLHRDQLVVDYARRQADSAAREAELKRNPPKPVNTTLRFWPKTSFRR